MSDIDDDEFMHEDDADEDYDFEYEDDDGDDDGDDAEEDEGAGADLEDHYYRAKARKEEDPAGALDDFQTVVEMEQAKGSEWGFKALKQLVKTSFRLGKLDTALDKYRQLLADYNTGTTPAITRNYAEKSVNNLLDLIATSTDLVFLERFYQLTLDNLMAHRNERLLVKTNLKLAKLWLDLKEYARLTKVLRKLKDLCQQPDTNDTTTSDDAQRKGTHLLEIYALEIQMYTATKNNKKLKEVYQQCLAVRSAISHPKIMGVIRECGGKMHMMMKKWDLAQQDFFEAFKMYDEAGSGQRIQCLKYLVLANMLTESSINPFDSQETKPYKNDAQIEAMTALVSAFQRKEIREFERILKGTSRFSRGYAFDMHHVRRCFTPLPIALRKTDNSEAIMGDPFIRNYIEDVLKNIRTQVLLQMVQPYRTVNLDFLARSLGGSVSVEQVEQLLVGLILDEKLRGRVDQINGRLLLSGHVDGTPTTTTTGTTSETSTTAKPKPHGQRMDADTLATVNEQRYNALARWNEQLTVLVRGPLSELRI